MKGLLLSIFFLSILTTTSIGQKFDLIDYGSDILKQAESSFCNGDTNQTIKTLEIYIEKYPNICFTLLMSKKLADFYLATGKTEQAISLLIKSIEINQLRGCYKVNDSCNFYKGLEPTSVKADICVTLSKFYTSKGDYVKALEYLNLADTKYLPMHGGCGNGMIMEKTKLSLDFADYYLTTGDTAKAIDRLMEYFLSGEYNDKLATKKLKSILLLSYNQKQITAEVNNCFNSMKVFHSTYIEAGLFTCTGENLHMTLFGRSIQKSCWDDHEACISYYKKHKNFLTLANE